MDIKHFFYVKKFDKVEGTAVNTEEVSKIKVGSFLVALSAILLTIGKILSGELDFLSSLTTLATEVGALLAVFGITDLPLLNSFK